MYIGREKGSLQNWRKMNAGADKILKSLDIPAKATQQLSSCSIAIQQMVAIARAVDMECKVLILDEPTSSLDEQEVEKLFGLMRDLKARAWGLSSSHISWIRYMKYVIRSLFCVTESS